MPFTSLRKSYLAKGVRWPCHHRSPQGFHEVRSCPWMPPTSLWGSCGDATHSLKDFNIIQKDLPMGYQPLPYGVANHSIPYGTPMGLPLTPLRSFYLECHSIFSRKSHGDATHLPEECMELTFGFPEEILLTAIRP